MVWPPGGVCGLWGRALARRAATPCGRATVGEAELRDCVWVRDCVCVCVCAVGNTVARSAGATQLH